MFAKRKEVTQEDSIRRPVRLDPTFLTISAYDYQEIRGGLSGVQVPVASLNPSVGTISSTPADFAVFNAGDSSNTNSVDFQPVASGSTTLTVGTPLGFSPPSDGNTSIVATVTP
jgi:hypothetical protein